MSTHSHGSRHRRPLRPLAARHGGRAARRAARTAPGLVVRVEQHATVALLRLAGDFDLAGVDRVEAALASAVDGVTDHVVFDLRRVSFLDLCALETLVRADARARRDSYAVHVVAPPERIARVLKDTDAGRRLHLLADLP